MQTIPYGTYAYIRLKMQIKHLKIENQSHISVKL